MRRLKRSRSEHGIDFYPAGTGISHQVMVEQGYVVPGALVVAQRFALESVRRDGGAWARRSSEPTPRAFGPPE